MILGIDEVGRGPLAGPLVVGAVVLGDTKINGLTDSKVLTKKKREELYPQIREHALGCATGWVSAEEIDGLGMRGALRLATRRAVEQIKTPFHEIIIDGTVNFLSDTALGGYVSTLKKADLLISSVSAASIIAKVERDNFMLDQDTAYPGYGFGAHSGYGTAKHLKALEQLGPSPIHRLSFAPLRKHQSRSATKENAVLADRETTKVIGDRAEQVAVEYLQKAGHLVLERNWKTRFCEIDIVSVYEGVVYFTEVKYRKDSRHGDGLAAITPAKLRQMRFAAEYYALKNKLNKTDMFLAAAAVSGSEHHVDKWLVLK